MARLAGYFLALASISVILAGYIATSRARDALLESVLNRISVVATLQEAELQRWVDHNLSDIVLLARSPDVQVLTAAITDSSISDAERDSATVSLREVLQSTLRITTDVQEFLVLADLGGRIVVSTVPTHEREYRPRDRFFLEGQKGPHVTAVYPSPVTITPTLTIATPLVGPDAAPLGVLAAHLNLTRMDRIITGETGLALSGETYLVDRYNAMVSSERFGAERFQRGVHTDGIDAAVSQIDSASVYLNYEGVPVIGAYRWIDELEVALLVEVPRSEAFAPAEAIGRRIVVAGLGLAVLLALGTLILARRIAAPILDITSAAVKVSHGDLHATAPVVTKDETGVLAQTFNEMTERLRKLYGDLKNEIVARTKAEEAIRELNLQLEERVRRRTAELKATNAELESFAYSVSHDLRAPLRAINGFSDALSEDFGDELNDEAKRYLDRIQHNSARMSELIDALLDLSRVTRHKMEVRDVDLTASAATIVRELRAVSPDRAVQFTASTGLVARGDPRLLRLAIENLLANAWKFTGLQERPEISFQSAQRNGDVVYCVKDNGVGFSMEYAGKLFGAFQRLHSEEEFEGTGIGLATVHRIISRHHGKIWCEAEEGRGAAFYFTLGGGKKE